MFKTSLQFKQKRKKKVQIIMQRKRNHGAIGFNMQPMECYERTQKNSTTKTVKTLELMQKASFKVLGLYRNTKDLNTDATCNTPHCNAFLHIRGLCCFGGLEIYFCSFCTRLRWVFNMVLLFINIMFLSQNRKKP